ncbi:MAG: DUF434 domain-containing protein [Sulfolobales archaeon]
MSLEKCSNLDHRVLEAARDYRYLLDRGYPRKPSLDLVVSRYILSRVERSLLLRCVHDSAYSLKILRSSISSNEIRGIPLIIDLLNVCTTIIAFLEGECLYLCDDGFVRDLGGSRYWRGKKGRVAEALRLITDHLTLLMPRKIYLVIDRKAPMSLSILAHAEDMMKKTLSADVNGVVDNKADRRIIDLERSVVSEGGAVATSDAVILERVSRAYDLAGKIVTDKDQPRVNRSIYDLFHRNP